MPKPIAIRLDRYDLARARYQAKQAEIGGHSHVRNKERKHWLATDQQVGMACEYALHKYWFGDSVRWEESRWIRNQTPHLGDGGSDLFGANVDVKGSLIRNRTKPLDSYHLVVRPRELQRDHIYILALATEDKALDFAQVFLLGWATGAELTTFPPQEEGPFQGAYAVPAKKLWPLMPLQWRTQEASPCITPTDSKTSPWP
jgi:hypothetical protein